MIPPENEEKTKAAVRISITAAGIDAYSERDGIEKVKNAVLDLNNSNIIEKIKDVVEEEEEEDEEEEGEFY
jgi:hypothetical protein